MSELTLLVLRLGLLALLWVFVFIVIYSVRSDMFGPRIPRSVRVAASQHQEANRERDVPTPSPAPSASASSFSKLVITAGPKAGTTIDLPVTGLTIGRSSGAGLQVSDDYTSTNHAKVSKRGDSWIIEDLGSTNGTFLSGKRVQSAAEITPGATIRVGTTQFELRQ